MDKFEINNLKNLENFIVSTKKIIDKINKISDKLIEFNNNESKKYKILKKKKIMLIIYLFEYICENNNIILFSSSINKFNVTLKKKSNEMANDLLLNYIDINIYNNLFVNIDINNIYELKKNYPYEYLYYLIIKWISIEQISNVITDNFIKINNILSKIPKPEKQKYSKYINIIDETNLRRSDRLKKLRS